MDDDDDVVVRLCLLHVAHDLCYISVSHSWCLTCADWQARTKAGGCSRNRCVRREEVVLQTTSPRCGDAKRFRWNGHGNTCNEWVRKETAFQRVLCMVVAEKLCLITQSKIALWTARNVSISVLIYGRLPRFSLSDKTFTLGKPQPYHTARNRDQVPNQPRNASLDTNACFRRGNGWTRWLSTKWKDIAL